MKKPQDNSMSFSGSKGGNRSQIFANNQRSNSPTQINPSRTYAPDVKTSNQVRPDQTSNAQLNKVPAGSTFYNPKFVFNSENTPRVVCHYHHDQFVTLFCRHPSCYMPLCPQCVKIHSQEHEQYNSHGQYDTLDNCLNEAFQKLSSYCNRFNEEIFQIKSNQGQSGDGMNEQIEKLRKARQQAYAAIDTFFNTLENELSQELQSNHKFLQEQSTNFVKYLESRQKSLATFLDKLNSDKCVKNLIKYYCQNVEQDNDIYFKESNNFMKQFNQSTPHVVVDQPAIYQLSLDLAQFASLKKGPKFTTKRQFEPFDALQVNDQTKYSNNTYLTQSPVNYAPPPSMTKENSGLENKPPSEEIHPYLRTPPKNLPAPQDMKQNNNSTSKSNPPIYYQTRQGGY